MARDRPERQREERRRDLAVDQFVALDLAVLEIEERLPADESTWRAESAPQIRGVETGRGRDVSERRIEDEPEEGRAVRLM